ncbi:MAG TPA: hypothetical protein VL332_03080 [Candidatus Saccharimonadaceae bacterium]|jgi:hypothetical protein|nr:hypothetical protein [Candidatus Saccharimonadaceae bacterium]
MSLSPPRTLRRALSLGGVLAWAVALAAGPARATGINLSWNDCGTAGVSNRVSSCISNTGDNVMIGSFVPPGGINSLVAMVATLDVQANAPVLPSWWQLRAGSGCRPTSMSGQFLFQNLSACQDYWSNQGYGAIDFNPGWEGLNHGRVRLVYAVGSTSGQSVSSGTEYYAFQLVINNARSSGAEACTGCAVPACIIFQSLELDQMDNPQTFTVTSPENRSLVTWQGGECQGGIRNKTWGQVKSTYHN